MDTAQLSAWFQANKTEVLMAGGAAVAGLALYNKRKTGAAASGAGVTAGAVAPGTMPAGAVVSGGSYDSSAFDAYNALQDEIGTLAQQNEAARQTGAGGSGVGAAVGAPIASTLFGPSGSGTIVRYGDGNIAEVESDGSQLSLTPTEWLGLYNKGAAFDQLGAPKAVGAVYDTASNLAAKKPAGAAGTAG